MLGATDDEELRELAVIVGMTFFRSNLLHAQNYDYNKFVQELKQMGEHVSKNDGN
jgi:hypothetical protein